MKRHILGSGLLLALTILLFRYPGESMGAARKGITLCLDLLIPSLFPFFVLSSLLIATGLASLPARGLHRLMGPLFGVSGAGAPALLLGLIGGYPVGARSIAQLVRENHCAPREAARLSLFCNNCGPAFFIGAVGVGIFSSRQAGFLLLGANLAAALLLGVLAGRISPLGEEPGVLPRVGLSPLSRQLPDCISGSFSSTLNICAYVILFSVLAALADCSGLLPWCTLHIFPGSAPLGRSFLLGLLEVSTGTAALADALPSPLALPLASFLLGWGGASVHCQSLPFWREAGVPVRPYLLAKAAQGALSAALTAVGMQLFPLSLPAMAPVLCPMGHGLPGRMAVALWALSGVFFSGVVEKGVEMTAERRYNRSHRRLFFAQAAHSAPPQGGTAMLFRKKIEPSCSYCQRGKVIDEETVLCLKRGTSTPDGSCPGFRYAPLKRVPPRPLALDFSRLKDEDFKL